MRSITKEKIWTGIAEMIVGTQQNDTVRITRGEYIVELALDTIPPSVLDNGKLMELNRVIHDIADIATPYLVGKNDSKKFHQALKRHQEILSELAGGN